VLVNFLVNPVPDPAPEAARNDFHLSHAHRVLRVLLRNFLRRGALRHLYPHLPLRLVLVRPACHPALRGVGAPGKAEIKYQSGRLPGVQLSQPRPRQAGLLHAVIRPEDHVR